MNQAMGRAKGFANGFTPGQRGIILVAILGLILGAVALTNWVSQPTWTPVFSQLSGAGASQVVEELQAQGVQYKLADGGATVLVPQSQVYDLRVSLSGKGIPNAEGTEGWAILDQQGMTATEFQQNTAYKRALEGELNKTLQSISGVNTAIVRLSIPEDSVFAEEKQKPTAAVLLSLAPGTTLSKGQVRSVTHLVAGSVPGLEPGKVTVSDGNGTMLTAPTDGSGGTGAAASLANDADEQTAQFEDRVAGKTQQMLDQVLGPGRAVVQVSAALDFDTKHSTTETYFASPVVPLSEETSREIYGNPPGGAGGLLGVVTPTPVASGASGSGYSKDSRTTNNGVGKSIIEAVAAPGAVKRLNVAVVLDSNAPGGIEPAKVQALVSSAVGIDSARGDVVQVDTLPFDTTATESAKKELEQAEAAAKTAGYVDLGKKAGLGLLLLIVAIVMMLKKRKSGGVTTVDATATDLPQGLLVPSRVEAIGGGRRELGAGPGGGREDEAPTPAIERERLRDEVASFVDSQPDEIAMLVQGWLEQRST